MTDQSHLRQAMDAAYQAAQAAVQDVLRQEADLRRALLDLDEMRLAAQALPDEQLAAPRAVGADLLWLGWTQRTRQELNMKLAQVLVRKADKMHLLRHAFGRLEAVNKLIATEKTALRKAAQGRDLDRDQYLALVNASTSAGARIR